MVPHNYAHYNKEPGNALGMCTVDEKDCYRTLELMYPYCRAILDCMCEEPKEEMNAMDPRELGSWEHAVSSGNAAWLNRGYHSQNCTFHVPIDMIGAVLYDHHLCQRGKDTMVEGDLHQGTSKSAEGCDASKVFEQAKKEGLQIEVHIEDQWRRKRSGRRYTFLAKKNKSITAECLRQWKPRLHQ